MKLSAMSEERTFAPLSYVLKERTPDIKELR